MTGEADPPVPSSEPAVSPDEKTQALEPADKQPTPTLEEHEADTRELASTKMRDRLGFGRLYAYGALIAAGVQVLIADGAFYVYGFENHWRIPSSAIEVWLGATVVQVIGVVMVIVRSLFPSEDPDEEP